MTSMGVLVCLAILLSAGAGVYLRLRQIATVARNRDVVPADFADRVTPGEHQRAADYTIARTRFGIAEKAFDALVGLFWLFFWLAPLYGLIAAHIEPGLTRSVVFVVAFGMASAVLDLPFTLANNFWLEEKFGFNRLTPATFAIDEIKSLFLGLAVATPALYGMFALLRALPETWWLLAWIAFMGLTVAMTVIYPSVIAPLFNTFTPMETGATRSRMEALLRKCGFESRGLFVMDASKRSAHGNAYFTGFGKAKRIVFFDTLLEKHTVEEIESILAHELGHFKFGHVRQMIAQSAIVALAGFAAIHWAFASPAFAGWFSLPHDPGVILVALLLVREPVAFALTPLLAWRSRRAEFEADDFARRMVGRDSMISALTRLTRDNLATLTPDPLYARFYFSHPPVPVRVARLRETTQTSN
jgi:STE24 endopeptidase